MSLLDQLKAKAKDLAYRAGQVRKYIRGARIDVITEQDVVRAFAYWRHQAALTPEAFDDQQDNARVLSDGGYLMELAQSDARHLLTLIEDYAGIPHD
jgi:hypothetical protein